MDCDDQYNLVIPALGNEAERALTCMVAGVPLLDRAIACARGARCASHVVVVTDSRAVARLARRNEVECVHADTSFMLLPRIELNPLAPLKTSAHVDFIADVARHSGAREVRAVTRMRHHPLGCFVADRGRMDFSGTLDAPQWRQLDARIFYQSADTVALYANKDIGPCLFVDVGEFGALSMRHEHDVRMADLAIARELFSFDDVKGHAWRVL